MVTGGTREATRLKQSRDTILDLKHWQGYGPFGYEILMVDYCTDRCCQILEVCYKSGVKVVTIYAFSTENFKRPKFEVDALMDMAKVKLTQICQHGELLERYGAKVQVLGEMDLVRPDVVDAMDNAVEMTKNNNQYGFPVSSVSLQADHSQCRAQCLFLIHLS